MVQPNEWQKVVRDAAREQKTSGKSALYVTFWERFIGRIAEEEPTWTRRRPGTTTNPNNWLDMPSPIKGASFNVSFARGRRLRNELYIDTGDGDENDRIYAAIAARRSAIEDAFGRPLEFESLEGKRAARIAEYADGDVTEEALHDEFIDWFIDSGRRLRRALTEILLRPIKRPTRLVGWDA